MKIVWSPAARSDVRAARRYVAERDEAAAGRLVRRLTATAPTLAANPGIGRPGRVSGTREFVVAGTHYIVVYRLHDDRLEIVRGSTPPGFGPMHSDKAP